MTSNFWRHFAISALKISKINFATFDFFVKMKLVSNVRHIKFIIYFYQIGSIYILRKGVLGLFRTTYPLHKAFFIIYVFKVRENSHLYSHTYVLCIQHSIN